MENKNIMHEVFGEVISKYTRDQAIEDGVLIDITDKAKTVGFNIPTVITQHLHSVLTDIPKSKKEIENYDARLADVLHMAFLRVKMELQAKGKDADPYLHFTALVSVPKTGRPVNQNLVIAFNGVEGFTVMYPEDD